MRESASSSAATHVAFDSSSAEDDASSDARPLAEPCHGALLSAGTGDRLRSEDVQVRPSAPARDSSRSARATGNVTFPRGHRRRLGAKSGTERRTRRSPSCSHGQPFRPVLSPPWRAVARRMVVRDRGGDRIREPRGLSTRREWVAPRERRRATDRHARSDSTRLDLRDPVRLERKGRSGHQVRHVSPLRRSSLLDRRSSSANATRAPLDLRRIFGRPQRGERTTGPC
jgi:hypothetical protein